MNKSFPIEKLYLPDINVEGGSKIIPDEFWRVKTNDKELVTIDAILEKIVIDIQSQSFR